MPCCLLFSVQAAVEGLCVCAMASSFSTPTTHITQDYTHQILPSAIDCIVKTCAALGQLYNLFQKYDFAHVQGYYIIKMAM